LEGCGASDLERAIGGTVAAASVLHAIGFRGDVTMFRRDATADGQSGSTAAFRQNRADRVYIIEAAHEPEVAGSNPAPLLERPWKRGLSLSSDQCGRYFCKRFCKRREASGGLTPLSSLA
jgi:hypothetical protein